MMLSETVFLKSILSSITAQMWSHSLFVCLAGLKVSAWFIAIFRILLGLFWLFVCSLFQYLSLKVCKDAAVSFLFSKDNRLYSKIFCMNVLYIQSFNHFPCQRISTLIRVIYWNTETSPEMNSLFTYFFWFLEWCWYNVNPT